MPTIPVPGGTWIITEDAKGITTQFIPDPATPPDAVPNTYSRTAATAAVTNTETVVGQIAIPANTLTVGRVYRVLWFGQYAATQSGVVTMRVRFGGAGTIADAVIVAMPSAAGGTASIPFSGEAIITVRAIGPTGSIIGGARMIGPPAVNNAQVSPAAVTISSEVQRFMTVTAQTAAATQNVTLHQVVINLLKP